MMALYDGTYEGTCYIPIDNTDEEIHEGERVFDLHSFAKKGCLSKLKQLLEDDPKIIINKKDKLGKTGVYIASENNHGDCVAALVKMGADCNIPDHKNRTPAYIAAKNKHYECLKQLLRQNADFKVPDTSDSYTKKLHQIVAAGDVKKLKNLLSEYKDKSISDQINKGDSMERTAVWIAAEKNCEECLALLLENGGSVNKSDLLGMTPLHAAVMHNSEECVKLLMEKNVDLIFPNYYGHTPIDFIFANISDSEKYIVAALDSRIQIENYYKAYKSDLDAKIETEKCKINNKSFKIDFTILSPSFEDKDQNKDQMKVIGKLFAASNKREKTEIFSHPIFELFLACKEKKRIYKCLNTFKLIALMMYWFSLYWYFIHLKTLVSKQKDHLHSFRYIIAMMTFTRVMFGFIQFATLPHLRFRKYNLVMNIATPSLILIIQGMEMAAQMLQNLNRLQSLYLVQDVFIYLMSITSLLICIEPFMFLSTFSVAANYAEMFFLILKRVLALFMMFIWILIGFAISFHILFDYYKEFSELPNSIFKTVVMMTGEFEYESIFNSDSEDNATAASVVMRIKLWISKLIFVLFIFLICIVVGNVMIGMAVQDIHALEKKYTVKKIQKKSEHFEQIEIFFVWLISNCKLKAVRALAGWFLKHSYVETSWTIKESELSLESLCALRAVVRRNEQKRQKESNKLGSKRELEIHT